MFISRRLARARIAQSARPGFIAAWWPVLADWGAIMVVLAATFGPVLRLLDLWNAGQFATITVFFFAFFVPLQIVLINATIWAVKSRWIDEDDRAQHTDQQNIDT